ncbi:MAG: HPr kinase/phosphorylase, partial [Xanthomonadales bacterium]|nr:HPr kinase/phosphorylase [Xanthomonadales bacterium]
MREALIRDLLAFPTGAVLVCGGVEPVEALRVGAEKAGIPLWSSSATPEVVLEQLDHYRHGLDASTVVHGELLEVFGLGVLITGGSGIGKSELALELISRGHRLIADDTPTLTRVASTVLEGTCPPALSDLLEVRGLGILNIRRMFGDSAIKRNKRVRLILHLVKMEEISPPADARLQGMRENRAILGVSVPAITLPI